MRIAVEEADQRGAELPVLKQVLGVEPGLMTKIL